MLKYTVSDLSGAVNTLIGPFFWLSGSSNTAAHLILQAVLQNRAAGFVLQRQGGFSDRQQVQTLDHAEALSRICLIKHSLSSCLL